MSGWTALLSPAMLRMAASVIAAAATAFGGLLAASSGPNVRGVLDRSTQTTACYPDEPCDPTPVGNYVVFSRLRHAAVRVRVAPNGSFAARLAPAWYRVSLAPPPLRGHVTPARIHVPRVGTLRLRLRIQP